MRLVLAVIAVAACGGGVRSATPEAPAADADPQGAHQAAVAAQVQPLLDAEIAGAIVVGLYDAGKLEIYGFGQGPGNAPPNGRTLFALGPVTAAYTSLLLADAVQRREVELDTPVADLLPPGVTVPTRDDIALALRHLVLHTSGLPQLPPSLASRANAPDPFAGYGENQLYADLVRSQLEEAPGARIRYAPYNVGLLGHVLGRKLGGYEQAVAARILKPLGLADTYFDVPAGAASRRAIGVNVELVRVPPWRWDVLAGAGGLISTARDQLALIEAELEASAGGKQPLRRAMAFTQEAQLEGSSPNVGLGWDIDREGRYWNAGSAGGNYAFVGFDPNTRRGIVLLASSQTRIVERVSGQLYKVLAGEQVEPPVMATEAQLRTYAGTYDFAGQPLKVIASGKRIYVEGPGEPKIRILPLSENQFWIEGLGSFVVFERTGDKVSRAVFIVGERQLAAPRIGD